MTIQGSKATRVVYLRVEMGPGSKVVVQVVSRARSGRETIIVHRELAAGTATTYDHDEITSKLLGEATLMLLASVGVQGVLDVDTDI